MDMEIHELDTDGQILAAFDLMATLRERIRRDTFVDEVRAMELDGYRLVGAFVGGKLVALAGVRRAHTLARGPHAFVDDLVTAEDERGKGYATALLRWVAQRALDNELPRVYLDARSSALGFYDGLSFQFLTSIPGWIHSKKLAVASEQDEEA